MFFRRKETPWEVVDSRSVDPVPMYYDEEDLEVVAIKDSNIRRTYVLQVKTDTRQSQDLPHAVMFAREQLLQEAKKNGYNILLLESWRVTVLRKAKLHRIEVEYSGRPARTLSQVKSRRPPFMDILQTSQ
ncbi:hypothetical protein B0H34DRAFT_56242 [Crassisporium funariophilum]|nr:hypothetical protein B0H34DRAFT_56242 [Crassisporium funariophilum]